MRVGRYTVLCRGQTRGCLVIGGACLGFLGAVLPCHFEAHELSKNAREEQSTLRPRWTERSKLHCGPVKVPSLTRAGPRGAKYTAASTQFGLEGCVFVSKSNWKVSDAERGRDWTMAASKG